MPQVRGVHANAAGAVGEKAARLVAWALYPPIVAVVLLGILTAHGTNSLLGFFQWWLLSIVFIAVIPVALVSYGLRRGSITNRTMTVASERALPFAGATLSLAVGAALIMFLSGPRELLGVLVSTIAGMLVALAFTPRFKISIHAAGVAGTVSILTIVFGGWALLLTPLVPLVGWARVRIAHHTVAQVIAGATIGAAVAAGVYIGVLAVV